MKTAKLSGSVRQNVGKKEAKELRAEGLVPGVLYGGDEQLHFVVKENDFNKLVFTPETYLVELDVEGKNAKCIIQELQFHPVTDRVLHFDLLQVSEDKEFKVKLPVDVTGNSIGIRNGGKLNQVYRKLLVKGLLKDLPETINVDIESVNIGEVVRVGDLSMEGVTFLNAPSAVIVGVKMARGAKKVEEEEAEEA